jgi:hypothetical protein
MDKNKCPKNEKPGPTFEKNSKIRFWILNYVFLSSKKNKKPKYNFLIIHRVVY